MALPGIPFQDNSADQQDGQEKKKKKRSVIDDIRSAKKIYDKARQYAQYAHWLANPVVLVFVLILAAALPILFSTSSGSALISGGDDPDTAPPGSSAPARSIPGLSLILTGPTSVDNGQNIQYKIEVIYSGTNPPLESLTIYNIIPSNTEFVEATGAYTLDSNKIEWPMSQNTSPFTFTLKPDSVDSFVVNTVYARIAPGASLGTTATTDTCGGTYNLARIPIGLNFGDPVCDFTKDKLKDLLTKLDPVNADRWYFNLVWGETGGTYYPNAFNPVSTSGTAWGLFQMGHEEYPSFDISKQMNNEFDRGDVDWSTQASNAVNYNKQRGDDFCYWGCDPYDL